jgi:hypothetical protein
MVFRDPQRVDHDPRRHLKKYLCLQNVGLYISIILTHRPEARAPSSPLSAENQCIECSDMLGPLCLQTESMN